MPEQDEEEDLHQLVAKSKMERGRCPSCMHAAETRRPELLLLRSGIGKSRLRSVLFGLRPDKEIIYSQVSMRFISMYFVSRRFVFVLEGSHTI